MFHIWTLLKIFVLSSFCFLNELINIDKNRVIILIEYNDIIILSQLPLQETFFITGTFFVAIQCHLKPNLLMLAVDSLGLTNLAHLL